MNAQELLVKIDTENEQIYGPIKINKYGGSNMYMNELEHRRWSHPDYQKYNEIKVITTKEDSKTLEEKRSNFK